MYRSRGKIEVGETRAEERGWIRGRKVTKQRDDNSRLSRKKEDRKGDEEKGV